MICQSGSLLLLPSLDPCSKRPPHYLFDALACAPCALRWPACITFQKQACPLTLLYSYLCYPSTSSYPPSALNPKAGFCSPAGCEREA
jgi:hypothetical protein